MQSQRIEFLSRLAAGIAAQFGPNCETVVHDLRSDDLEHTVVAIENGHVTGREIGDGPSNVVLKALHDDPASLKDRLSYLTRTEDGRLLKSTTIFYRDEKGLPCAIFAINFDITLLVAAQETIGGLTSHADAVDPQRVDTIPNNVADLLDELIQQSEKLVGKPVALMTKEDKVKAIGFLNDSGAFLVTKSGAKVCSHFGISKYTLYSYLDEAKKK